jgi:hypothetical protein
LTNQVFERVPNVNHACSGIRHQYLCWPGLRQFHGLLADGLHAHQAHVRSAEEQFEKARFVPNEPPATTSMPCRSQALPGAP